MSSDSDAPIVKGRPNGAVSRRTIPESVDLAMDKELGLSNGRSEQLEVNVSIRNGPVMEMHAPATNGVVSGKRKQRSSINGKSYKERSSSYEDDRPVSKRRKMSSAKARSTSDSELSDIPSTGRRISRQLPPKIKPADVGETSSSDVPLGRKLATQKKNIEQAAEKEAKAMRAADRKALTKRKLIKDESDSDDVPIAKTKKAARRRISGVKKEPDDNVPLHKKAASSKRGKTKAVEAQKAIKVKAVAKKEMDDEDEELEAEEEDYKWWEDPAKGDDSIKWTSLEHNGVVFPPEYEPLPDSVRLRYDEVPVSLHKDAEEVATFFGSMLNSTHNVENPTFQKNFFDDFRQTLDRTGHGRGPDGKRIKIERFDKCDFTDIYQHFAAQREAKKALPAAEKKALKVAKDEAEKPYMFCLWDGRKQKVGNFRVEPPGLFRGRGEHPKTGKVKKRVTPEQITINLSKNVKVPPPPADHQWKEVKHDQTGTWLAMWQENINGAYKYVMLAANSDIKGQSDFKKFEKARELKKHIDRIRKDYTRDLKSEMMADRQRATAVYLIDKFAFRAGNEKGEDEAETVGACSLKFENVSLKPPNTVVFDFLGKDSIRYYDEVEVDPQVFKNLKIFKKQPKKDGDEIFDRLTTSGLNKYLSSYMAGLTAKVFRTYNASYTMARLLREMTLTGTTAEKVKDYNEANRKVAILCNHKRTVAATHGAQIEKMQEKINGLRYQQWRIKQMMLDLDKKAKREKGADYFELPEDLTQEWVEQHQQALVEEQRDKIRKKFEKENEKRVAEGEGEMKTKDLQERLQVADELERKFKVENKTRIVEAEGKGVTVDKLEAKVDQLQQRVETAKVQMEDKDNNKEVALGTSKINYIDPRLTVVFSKRFNVPIERFFSKMLREKFDWAIKSAGEDWEF